jgi:acyl-CoA reductase-like NAD-dependent aldehyde dehydrogenase
MAETITTISPITNKGIIERKGLSDSELSDLASKSAEAFKSYKKTSLEERKTYIKKALEIITSKQDELAKEITEQMGRPIAYTAVEVKTAVARGEYLLKIAEDALSDTPGEPQEGFKRFVRKVPLGPVLVLFPWNVSLAGVLSTLHSTMLIIYPSLVPIPYPRQLDRPRSSLWQQCHHQAFATNTNSRRTSRFCL